MKKLNFKISTRPADTSRGLALDLLELEKKQESERNTYTVTCDKLKESLLTSGKSDDKRIKKLKEYELGSAISELATATSQVHAQLTMGQLAHLRGQPTSRESQSSSIKREHRNFEDLATILQRFGDAQMHIAKQRVYFESAHVETQILPKLQTIINEDVPGLQKQKKALVKMESEYDSLKSRLTAAEEKLQREKSASGSSAVFYTDSHQVGGNTNLQSTGGSSNFGSADGNMGGGGTLKSEQLASLVSKLRDELDEANSKLEATRETYAIDLYAFDARTSDRAGHFVSYLDAQLAYYRSCASTIEAILLPIRNTVDELKRIPVYGSCLQEHLQATRREIALPLQFCAEALISLDAIKEEGLFRIAGGHARLRNLKRSFDVGRPIDVAEYAPDVHALTGAIKQYLRELQEPLLTFELYNLWLAAASESGEAGRAAMKACVEKLPLANLRNLAYLIQFLQLVVRNADTNRMSANNLAICVGPNLLWSPNEPPNAARAPANSQPASLDFAASSNHVCAAITETLISNYDYFFPNMTDFFSNIQESGLQRTQSPRSSSKVPPPLTPTPPPKAEVGSTTPTSTPSASSTPPADQRAPHFTTVTDIPLAHAVASNAAPPAASTPAPTPASVPAALTTAQPNPPVLDTVDSAKVVSDNSMVTLSSQTREARPQATTAPSTVARISVNPQPAPRQPPVRRPPAPPSVQAPAKPNNDDVVIETSIASSLSPSPQVSRSNPDARASPNKLLESNSSTAAPVGRPPKPAAPPSIPEPLAKERRPATELVAKTPADQTAGNQSADVSLHNSVHSRVSATAGTAPRGATNGSSASSTPSGSVGSFSGKLVATDLRNEAEPSPADQSNDAVKRRSSNAASSSNAPTTLPKPTRSSLMSNDKQASITTGTPANPSAAPIAELKPTVSAEESTYL